VLSNVLDAWETIVKTTAFLVCSLNSRESRMAEAARTRRRTERMRAEDQRGSRQSGHGEPYYSEWGPRASSINLQVLPPSTDLLGHSLHFNKLLK
jgi:hypothetical protein